MPALRQNCPETESKRKKDLKKFQNKTKARYHTEKVLPVVSCFFSVQTPDYVIFYSVFLVNYFKLMLYVVSATT